MQLNKNNGSRKYNFTNKHIGIWGYGVTGAAATRYFQLQKTHSIAIFNEKPLSYEIQQALAQKNIVAHSAPERELFFNKVDYIIKSPGIPCDNLEPHYKAKIISEFDMFAASWQGPVVAITGTVGKTTVTSVLNQLLHTLQKQSVAGGNIGTPMLELLMTQSHSDYAIIELSSFHTELGITVAPDLAIITNVYPNHLDRHGSLEHYRNAKLELIRHQTIHQKALLPLSCAPYVQRPSPNHLYSWFSLHEPSLQERAHCLPGDTLYYGERTTIVREENNQKTVIGLLQPTTITFVENIIILTAALDLLGLSLEPSAWNTISIPSHRLAPIATYNDIVFYNDSKSTVPAATLAAVQQLAPHKPILFLGGLSKGVDRKPFIAALRETISLAICFGGESDQLAAWCKEYHIPVCAEPTLEEAYHRYMQQYARAGDHVLFSPAGASFDLFKDYGERGERFIALVQQTIAQGNAYSQVQPGNS